MYSFQFDSKKVNAINAGNLFKLDSINAIKPIQLLEFIDLKSRGIIIIITAFEIIHYYFNWIEYEMLFQCNFFEYSKKNKWIRFV